jgi:hypothetical protein
MLIAALELPAKPPMRLPCQAALSRRKEQLASGVAPHPTIISALVPWAKKLGVTQPTPVHG